MSGFFNKARGLLLPLLLIGGWELLSRQDAAGAYAFVPLSTIGSALIEQIPLAALIGVMFVVAEKTFEWGSFRLFGKVPRADVFVGLLVAGITVYADLAIAVIVGVIVSALVFAWQHAKEVRVSSKLHADGRKLYEAEGTVFFASVASFAQQFTPNDDPDTVEIDFRRAKLMDHSAIEAVNALAERYLRAGKQLRLKHLSRDCLDLLDNAKAMIEVNYSEDPQYRVADDKLG